MKKIIITITIIILTISIYLSFQFSKANNCCSRCTGSSYCSACSDCSQCIHCNSGGSCGICSPSNFENYEDSKINEIENKKFSKSELKNLHLNLMNKTTIIFNNSKKQDDFKYPIWYSTIEGYEITLIDTDGHLNDERITSSVFIRDFINLIGKIYNIPNIFNALKLSDVTNITVKTKKNIHKIPLTEIENCKYYMNKNNDE
jgi:hypothetical protein